jgi:hypothetical protein
MKGAEELQNGQRSKIRRLIDGTARKKAQHEFMEYCLVLDKR